MSWVALSWASKQKVGSSPRKFVLTALANFCDDENKCFPSIKTIMQFTELSESTVKRCLKDLDNNNFISIENRFETFLGDAKRQTSNMYHLQVGVQTDTHGVQPETGGGVTVKPHVTTNKNHIYCQDFLKVWNAYPRKDGSKKKAYEIWTKITEKDCIIIKKDLFNHVEKYNKLNKNKDLKFIPHFTTWLNQRRWETETEAPEVKPNLNQLVG